MPSCSSSTATTSAHPLGERRGATKPCATASRRARADGAVPVGSRRRRPLPRRGRRRAPHAQRRVGHLPVGPDHPRAEPARRRRRLPPHRRGRVGSRRPRRGRAGVPRPDRAGDLLGLRRQPPRQPHRARSQLRPEFFDVYLELAVEFGLPMRMAGESDRAQSSGSRSGAWPPRRASCSPTTSCVRARRRRPPARRAGAVRAAPGVTEVYLHPARRHRRAARRLPATGRGGSRTSPPYPRQVTAAISSSGRA